MTPTRRALLAAAGLKLTPLVALSSGVLSACGDARDAGFAEGMAPIHWDRDTCARCGMAISDRRFAAQIRGGARNTAVLFDDIGCATTWCAEKGAQHPWVNEPATRFWVAAFHGTQLPADRRWLDARQAHYAPSGARSPMGYNLAAMASAQPDSIGFADMHQRTSSTWPANCLPSNPGGSAPLSRPASAPQPA